MVSQILFTVHFKNGYEYWSNFPNEIVKMGISTFETNILMNNAKKKKIGKIHLKGNELLMMMMSMLRRR
jgi:hypothetical protein